MRGLLHEETSKSGETSWSAAGVIQEKAFLTIPSKIEWDLIPHTSISMRPSFKIMEGAGFSDI